MILRAYRPSDLKAIFALDQVCFAAPFRFSERAMRRFAEAQNAMTVVAEDELSGEIAGFAIAHAEGNVAYVVTLDVAPVFRRHGLAGSMMGLLEQKARERRCGAMELHVSVENDAAIEFYEKQGWARMGRVRRFYGAGGDAWVYGKRL